MDENHKVRDRFEFKQNNLVITSIDIQSVEPVDQRTRESLQKSVQLAIEITTNSQEATAKHEAERLEQEAKGRLDRQKIHDEAEAEKAKRGLLELQVRGYGNIRFFSWNLEYFRPAIQYFTASAASIWYFVKCP